MYLSRLLLNARSRAVRHDLVDCQALHRTVMSAFPQAPMGEAARSHLGVLHRLDSQRTGALTLLVQSRVEPDWSKLEPDYLADTPGGPANPACKRVDELYAHIGSGMELAFRLRANPTRKIDTRSGPDGQRRNGKRVELREEEKQIDWLHRKGERGGFRLVSVHADAGVPNVRTSPGGKLVGQRRAGPVAEGAEASSRLTFASVLFDGVLRVTDPELFRRTLADGVGAAKAYGFGLLTVAPAGR